MFRANPGLFVAAGMYGVTTIATRTAGIHFPDSKSCFGTMITGYVPRSSSTRATMVIVKSSVSSYTLTPLAPKACDAGTGGRAPFVEDLVLDRMVGQIAIFVLAGVRAAFANAPRRSADVGDVSNGELLFRRLIAGRR